jgi:hypothetical protein
MDIRIDSRFRAQTQVGDIIVRALSDTDVQQLRRLALEESAKEREELADPDSERRKELVDEAIAGADEEMMRDAIVQFEAATANEEAEDTFPFSFIPFPDSASLEERHEVIRERREHEEEVRTQRAKYIDERLERLRKKVEGWDAEILERELEIRIINSWAMARFTEGFQYQTLVLSCFKDGVPLFGSWQEVRGYSSRLIRKLFAAYREVDSVNPWELEKNVLTGPTTG